MKFQPNFKRLKAHESHSERKNKHGSAAGYSVGLHSGRLVPLLSTMEIWIVNSPLSKWEAHII